MMDCEPCCVIDVGWLTENELTSLRIVTAGARDWKHNQQQQKKKNKKVTRGKK